MTTYTEVTPNESDDTVNDLVADIMAGVSGIYDVQESTEDTDAANAALFDWAAAQPDPNPEPLAR